MTDQTAPTFDARCAAFELVHPGWLHAAALIAVGLVPTEFLAKQFRAGLETPHGFLVQIRETVIGDDACASMLVAHPVYGVTLADVSARWGAALSALKAAQYRFSLLSPEDATFQLKMDEVTLQLGHTTNEYTALLNATSALVNVGRALASVSNAITHAAIHAAIDPLQGGNGGTRVTVVAADEDTPEMWQ